MKATFMQWNSPWGKGYPLAHRMYGNESEILGRKFDIHGGGLENQFPHHECEIAQAEANTERPLPITGCTIIW